MINIVIPTCNRVEMLSNCLNCLNPVNQNTDTPYKVIVSDDSNTDLSELLVKEKFPWVDWVQGPRKGPAANRNNGARCADGEWLLFIDDDCLPDSHIIETYISSIQSSYNIDVFEGGIFADRPQHSFDEESPINETGGYLWSCNFMIRRDLFKSIGEFDENFPHAAMEDMDLAYRLKLLNIDIKFLKSAFVIHPWRKQKDPYRIIVKRFESTLYFLEKHPEMKRELNSLFFLRSAYHSFYKSGLKNIGKYRFRGIKYMFIQSIMKIHFAFRLLSI